MLKKTFGKTGLDLSILGFGCMRLPLTNPSDPTAIDADLATAMIRKSIDQGVNYIDTAWPYHGDSRIEPGRSELLVAQALKGGYREKVHLATKLPTWFIQDQKQMNTVLDTQLKRLETPYIDFYLAHNLNGIVWPGIRDKGLFRFLDEALKDGRIKHAGFSFHDRYEIFEEIIKSYDWSFGQIQYNYLDVNYQAGQRGLKLAAERGLGTIIMEPLRGGFLINHVPEESQANLRGARPDWSLATWALRWLWSQPEVNLVLSGMSTMAQVEENLAIASQPSVLTERDLAALGQVVDLFRERLKINCTSCGYCLPCPQDVNIPKNFSYYNDYFLVDSEEVRSRAKFYFSAQVAEHETFAHCVHCGECEEKCPQKLPISDLMDEVAKVFG
ncbi:MAG: aldo/keto reductase [Candidatus Adiutrix sp.]|jgi:predicted aldo/keto reductase-like oxidoreductase|nr:aldo/keto reductase [Candidatus Adiutrix sp.]